MSGQIKLAEIMTDYCYDYVEYDKMILIKIFIMIVVVMIMNMMMLMIRIKYSSRHSVVGGQIKLAEIVTDCDL